MEVLICISLSCPFNKIAQSDKGFKRTYRFKNDAKTFALGVESIHIVWKRLIIASVPVIFFTVLQQD